LSLGADDEVVLKLDAADCMRAVTAGVIKSAGNVLAMLQYLSPMEQVPSDANAIMSCVSQVPKVVD
jgi:hypothetical protein